MNNHVLSINPDKIQTPIATQKKFVSLYNSDTRQRETYAVSKEDFDNFNSKKENILQNKKRFALVIGGISAVCILADITLVKKLLTAGIIGYFAGAFAGGIYENGINKEFIKNHQNDITGQSDIIIV